MGSVLYRASATECCFQQLKTAAGGGILMCAGNTDAMQLLGGLLSVLPERVSKTMQAHKDVLLKRVSASRGGLRSEAPYVTIQADSVAAVETTTCRNSGHAGGMTGALAPISYQGRPSQTNHCRAVLCCAVLCRVVLQTADATLQEYVGDLLAAADPACE
jgi:hypothetical protein